MPSTAPFQDGWVDEIVHVAACLSVLPGEAALQTSRAPIDRVLTNPVNCRVVSETRERTDSVSL